MAQDLDMKHRLKGCLAMKNKQSAASLSAAMTLEASIALPLFIFFFLNIMSAIMILRVQSELEAQLHQTGNEIALRAFDVREGESILGEGTEDSDGGILESAGYAVYVEAKIKKEMKSRLDKSSVMDGAGSLNFLSSRIMQNGDIIDIVVRYKVHPIVSLIGFKNFNVESRYYGHAWTGYDIGTGTGCETLQEEMVYVTEHGEVYHRNVDCKYLKTSAKSVSFSGIGSQRNKDRKKYYPCEYCGQAVSGGNVFITGYGDRYHGKVDCPGLKRKIYTISIYEVGGRSPCSACG